MVPGGRGYSLPEGFELCQFLDRVERGLVPQGASPTGENAIRENTSLTYQTIVW